MNKVYYYEITDEESGQRLDNLLIRILKGVPKSRIYRLIRCKEIKVNDKRAEVSTRLVSGDKVRIPPIRVSHEKTVEVSEPLVKQLQKAVIFEDNELIVLNKPSGLAVHGGSGLSLGLIEALRQSRPQMKWLELVHRLDKETSGCILVAKKRSCLRLLQQFLMERKMEKTYWALLAHPWDGEKVKVVTQPLQKNVLKSGERVVVISANGKEAETEFRLIENFQDACLVEIFPKTGRTHQIRVHSAFLGHPIIGDNKYGTTFKPVGLEKMRLYLHARAIQFKIDDRTHHYQASIDSIFIEALMQLRARRLTDA